MPLGRIGMFKLEDTCRGEVASFENRGRRAGLGDYLPRRSER